MATFLDVMKNSLWVEVLVNYMFEEKFLKDFKISFRIIYSAFLQLFLGILYVSMKRFIY